MNGPVVVEVAGPGVMAGTAVAVGLVDVANKIFTVEAILQKLLINSVHTQPWPQLLQYYPTVLCNSLMYQCVITRNVHIMRHHVAHHSICIFSIQLCHHLST